MKKLAWLLLLTTGAGCANRHFKVTEAISQARVSGVRGQGTTITYTLTLQPGTTQPLSFDTLWVGQEGLAVQFNRSPTTSPKEPLRITAFRTQLPADAGDYASPDNPAPAVAPSGSKPPFAYEGAALLRYSVKGQTHYRVIKELKTLPEGVMK